MASVQPAAPAHFPGAGLPSLPTNLTQQQVKDMYSVFMPMLSPCWEPSMINPTG